MGSFYNYDLKNEDDVKEYLKNLLIEYNFGCFSEKKGDVCHLLGDYHEVVVKDYKESGNIYKNTCDYLKFNRSCTKFGGYSVVGKGCDKDKNRGYQYMKQGCDLGDALGCANAGILVYTNSDVQIDDTKAPVEMMTKACNLANQKACSFLGQLYLQGFEARENREAVPKDLTKAAEFIQKACDLGNPYACKLISKMYARGEGVQTDKDKAEHYRKRALNMERHLKYFKDEVKFGEGTG